MPPDLTSKFQLAGQHIAGRKFEQARQVLLKILHQSPGHPDAGNGMAIVLEGLGQFEQAAYFAERAVAARPGDAILLNTHASILSKLGRHDDAQSLLRRAIAIEPERTLLRSNLADSLWNSGRCVEATRELRAMHEASPHDATLAHGLATKLTVLGRAPEAVALCRQVLAQATPGVPGFVELVRALATSILNDPHASVEDVVRAHHHAGNAVVASLGIAPRPSQAFPNDRSPNRPVRIGFVSPDFRQHSVSYFVESILEHVDRSAFQVLCYSNSTHADAVTARLKRLSSEFVTIASMGTTEAADRIARDRVDVLVDLAGHSVGTRLDLFALRAAPVQVAYCGYPATTGLNTMDYRLVDSLTDPVGSESHCTERLARLDPSFLCYRPLADAPAVAPPPHVAAGHITFGSFNATFKLNDATLDLWSRVLLAVPHSRLVLKALALSDAEFRTDLLERFAARGIEVSRVDCLPATKTLPEHLAAYARVDIGLDPFPYHGTTTTCEAAHMGVPTVSLRGEMHHGRVGASLLTSLGLADLVASNSDEYVARSQSLAASSARLVQLRQSLRTTLAASPLGDAPGFSNRFADAIRGTWHAWCERRA